MKKYLSIVIVLFALTANNAFATATATVDKNPIVDINIVEEFGIWRVYNDGDDIYIVDSIRGRIIKADDEGHLRYYPPEGGVYNYYSFVSGSTDIDSSRYPNVTLIKATDTITPTAHLQDGLFGFGNSRFRTNDETMIIYEKDNYNNATKKASLKIVLNKFSNRVLVEGRGDTSNFEPTDVVSPGDIAGPAKILGDCNASYNSVTGILSIPCFSIDNERTVHQINLNQTPNTLNFAADLGTFIRVQ